jgi:S-DNA-T family DNA segregation ATPase FtsK/SpoIIIE
MSTIPFHRPARVHPDSPPREPLALVLPPTVQPPPGKLMTWLTALSPMVLTMGSMFFFFVYPLPGIIKFILPIVMVGGVVMSGGVRALQTRYEKKKKAAFHSRYLTYLEDHEIMLRERAALQLSSTELLNPDADGLWTLASDRSRLWERRRRDPDFLRLRVGVGDTPLISAAVMAGPPNPLEEYEPDLMEAMKSLVERYTVLHDAPVTIDCSAAGSVAIAGDPMRTQTMARSLICSAATLHSPDDVVVAVAYPKGRSGDWSWLKWLPHCRDRSPNAVPNGSGPPCLIADSGAGLATLINHLASQRLSIIERWGRPDAVPGALGGARPDEVQGAIGQLPHVLLVVDGYEPRGEFGTLPQLREILSVARAAGMTIITTVHTRNDEPSHVDTRMEIDADGMVDIAETGPSGRRVRDVLTYPFPIATAETIARCLAPLRLEERRDTRHAAAEMAATIELLDLLRIPSAGDVDPRETWPMRRGSDVLRVPLGLRVDGEPLVLDLKEAAVGGMGPHGLVIGATGSGKSELLRTLVTGLAVTHPPDLLSFVFVDFKGGAAFADLSELPHVAGMITNLQGDLSRVDRMHSALVGEQERRQRLLREAGNVDGIKEYQARRAANPALPPMPYLVIVVDEFGELLAARPEFLDLFVAIGRVGRSLGMHLLFATQRLEEGRIRGLEGHLRYRICLRTFSPQESSAVIGTPDAYNLPPFPGAGYFKVDTTTYHRFKTALITSPYEAGRSLKGERAPVALFAGVTHADAAAAAGESSGPTAAGSSLPTEMEVAIDRLNELGAGLAPPVHQVWLPPLPETLPLNDVFAMAEKPLDTEQPFGTLHAPIGMLDLPLQQTVEPFVLDFAGTGGHLMLAGAPQTGKSTFLRTLICSFALTHSPEEVQFYCIDLGGGTLHGLEGLPHVGAVASKLDRDLLRRIIRQMHSVIEEREILFRKHAIDSMTTFRAKRRAGELPPSMGGDVFLVIDNWSAFKQEVEESDLEIQPLVAAGLGFGVHVVITSPRWADIRATLKDNIGGRYELRINDPMDSEMPRGASKTLPQNIAGRGLAQTLHFQVALPRIDGKPLTTDIAAGVADFVGKTAQRWKGRVEAPRVRLLPSVVRLEDLPAPTGDIPGVPMGLEEFRLEPAYLDLLGTEPHFLLLGDSESGKTNFMRGWMHQLRERYTPEQLQFCIVDYRRTLLDVSTGDHILKYAATNNVAKEVIEGVRQTLTERLPPVEITRDELINRSWWQGPEIALFVDDYDLVVTPTGNPVSPLVELLAQGRDVGFHLILARRVGGVARSAFEPVMQRVKELGSPTLVMSGDPQEGPVAGTQRAQLQPPGRGFLVRRGQRTALVQTVKVDPLAE